MPAAPKLRPHQSTSPMRFRARNQSARLLRGDAAAGAGSLGLLVLPCQGQTARSSHRTPGRVALAANFSLFAKKRYRTVCSAGLVEAGGRLRMARLDAESVCCPVGLWTLDKQETNFFSHAVSFFVQSLQCPRPLPHDVGSLTSRLKPPCRLTAPPRTRQTLHRWDNSSGSAWRCGTRGQ